MDSKTCLEFDLQRQMDTVEQRDTFLLNSKNWTDCTFIVGKDGYTEKFDCHRLYLAKTSEVFATMLYGKWRSVDGVNRVDDLSPEVFSLLLDYMYKGHVILDDYDLTCGLLYAAKKYLLPESLLDQCRAFLSASIDMNLVWSAFEFGDTLNEPYVEDAALKVVQCKTSEAMKTYEFLNIPNGRLVSILQQDTLNVKSELEIIEASVKWAKHDVIRRGISADNKEAVRTALDPALKHIRFLTLNFDELTNCRDIYFILKPTEIVAILKCLNNNDASLTNQFCNLRFRRVYKQETCVDRYNKSSFLVDGVPFKLLPDSENYLDFEFCPHADISQNWHNSGYILGLQCPSQIKPNDCQSTTYDEDFTVLIYNSNLKQVVCSQRFTKNVEYDSLINLIIHPHVYYDNEFIGVKIVFHKSGKYPKILLSQDNKNPGSQRQSKELGKIYFTYEYRIKYFASVVFNQEGKEWIPPASSSSSTFTVLRSQ